MPKVSITKLRAISWFQFALGVLLLLGFLKAFGRGYTRATIFSDVLGDLVILALSVGCFILWRRNRLRIASLAPVTEDLK
jgi:hypothetical protein